MIISSSSDEDEPKVVKKNPSFKKLEELEETSIIETDVEEMSDTPVQPFNKKKNKKTMNNKSQQNRSKTTKTRTRSQKKPIQKKLKGKYSRKTTTTNYGNVGKSKNNRRVKDSSMSSSESSSSSEEVDDKSLKSSSDDDPNLLYENETFITCRNTSNSFYLCQVLQNIYTYTKSIPIRWYSPIDEDGDDTKINIHTKFKAVYKDKLDPDTILLSIPDIIYHEDDNTVSLKKQHIVDTKRLLVKSIRGESLSSDDMMDLSTEHQNKDHPKKKISKHIRFDSSTESDSSSSSQSSMPVPSKTKKRKKVSEKKKSRKQPAKKRQRTKASSEVSDNNDEKPTKPKKKAVISKAQLFKVHSNSTLKKNSTITEYVKEPFFEDNLIVPFISSYIQSKLAIRAVLINDSKLLKKLINDVDHVCSVHVARSLHNELTASHYAIQTNNKEILKMLLDDIKSPKKKRCPFPIVSMKTQDTGKANIYTLGFRTAPIMASRGAKEGNNALNKDKMEPIELDSGEELITYALKNNCSREIYDLLFKTFTDYHDTIYENIHKIIRAGHRKLAASIIGDIKDNTFHGFNYLHHQVLLYDNEDITINRSASVIKKTRANFMITPIHCAAINPNAKYLKQLLTIMPEYNILDKYERRPIHFAAACEGSDPLEYLLSKFVTFNDVDRGGNTPLHIAVMNGRSNNAELLLRTAKDKSETEEGEDQTINEKFGLASINRMNKSRFYPLHLAVLNNHLNCVEILLEYNANMEITTCTASGKLTPLMLACQKGYLNIVKYLIEHGAKIEVRDRLKRTALIHACMCGNADIVSYLLRLGANPNVFDSSLNTALHYAIAYGWYFCVQLLLEADANLNCVNSWQTTCLATGFLKGHYGLCDYLLTNHHVDINFKTDDGLTLVMLTVELEISSAVVEQLEYVVVKHNADCTTTDAHGSNAFHYLAANLSNQNTQYIDENAKKNLHENYFKIAKILLDNNCDPNKMNKKFQSPLMIALELENFILVDYLINKVKININSDISHDGKTLLHYFANKCDQYDLVQALFKIPINDEIKKMGQIFDNNGRTPFHYCASKFNEFCQLHKSSTGTEELKKKYRSIVQMIEFCLETIECNPDIEIKPTDQLKTSNKIQDEDDDDGNENEDEEVNDDDGNEEVNNESEKEEQDISESDEENEEKQNENMVVNNANRKEDDDGDDENENPEEMDQTSPITNEKSNFKLKETSVFSLLSTVSFIDSTEKHPLEIFLQKTKNPNVRHHKTHRTPLLEAIIHQQIQTSEMLIHNSLCDINLSTSNLSNERQQTPLIFACKLQLLSIIQCLLNHKKCDISLTDYVNNQAIHYYLQTSNRSNKYLEILKIFIEKLKNLISLNSINIQGKSQRTPLHIAVYHNLGTIDAITDIEKILIENGSDLFLKDDLGNIPLHNVFLNKKIGHDPVELCLLIMKSMKYQSLDTYNNNHDTPLHLAVAKCCTVCVMLLQEHNANILAKNILSNSIIGTCIASDHLNLFITFLQQSIKIDLRTKHYLPNKDLLSKPTEEISLNLNSFGRKNLVVQQKEKSIKKKENKNSWKWKYLKQDNSNKLKEYSLIYLIIERDWQGALSLILNDIHRFQLDYIDIFESAILNNKTNLVFRLLYHLKDEFSFSECNNKNQNLYHLLANMNLYDESLLKQILLFINEYQNCWNKSDDYGCTPLHYACVKHNFVFINFLHDLNVDKIVLTKCDRFNNTPIGLLFWYIRNTTTFPKEKFRLFIKSGDELNCLCNYDNEIAMDPFSFNYIPSINEIISYPPEKSNHRRTSPLINAIVYNNFSLVQFLLELNADVNFPDDSGRTPLWYAIQKNNIDMVKILLNKDYTPENNQISKLILPQLNLSRGRRQKFFLGSNSVTTTNEISNNNQTKEFQLTSSIDLKTTQMFEGTYIQQVVHPFSDMTYRNNIEILQILVQCGAPLTKSNYNNLTPLECSIQYNFQHLTNELIRLTNSKKQSFQKTIIKQFQINDPNKHLLSQPNFYKDAQHFIDKYLSTHPIIQTKTKYQVDPISGMNSTGEIVIDSDKNQPYDVRLTKTDINYGTYGLYNFYCMQIIKQISKNNLYFLFTRWGRIGYDEGQHQLTPYSTLDECIKEFTKIFREKTGNLWKDTDQFETKPKKYTLIQLNEYEMKKSPHIPINFQRLQSKYGHPPSKLHSSIYRNLMRIFLSRQVIRHDIHKTELDVDWMPASQLKRETLEKARDLLRKIKELIEQKEKFHSETSSNQTNDIKSLFNLIYQYTNEYYSLIPLNNNSIEKLKIIQDENILKQQEKKLEDLFQLELSYKILLGAQTKLKIISPLDYIYKCLNCQFELLNQDDIITQFILRYIWTSAPNIQVENIFKIAQENVNERFEKCHIDNRYLLWHGTGICNLISILNRGLLGGSLAADTNGSLFGTGIYTADTFVKSLGYCEGVRRKNYERCFMLLCEVALGNIKEIGAATKVTNNDGEEDDEEEEQEQEEDDDKPLDLKKFQSRKGVGRSVPDPKHTIVLNSGLQIPLGGLIDQPTSNRGYGLNYNEYIVYDEAQIAIRYLIQFRR